MTRNIKLTIEYDGTNYAGWQSQINALSIQDVIEKALTVTLNKKTKIIGSSRTDTGVHAKCQVANFNTDNPLSLWNIKQSLNQNLPKDINIINCEEVSEDFHSRFSAKGKYYRYVICKRRSPFNLNYSYIYFKKLSIDKMIQASSYLIGTHDFSSFTPIHNKKINYKRHISKIEITETDECIYFDFEGISFLHFMVRTIVGTLIKVGKNTIPPEYVKEILEFKDRKNAGPTVPSKGLFLMKIFY